MLVVRAGVYGPRSRRRQKTDRQDDAIEEEDRGRGRRARSFFSSATTREDQGRPRWTAETTSRGGQKGGPEGPGRNSDREKPGKKKEEEEEGPEEETRDKRQPERERGRSTSTLPHGLERAEPGQERPVRGRMQAVGQNDTGTGKSNHEPVWTRSYRGYRARRPSRDDGQAKRRKGNGRKVADIGQYQKLFPLVRAVLDSTDRYNHQPYRHGLTKQLTFFFFLRRNQEGGEEEWMPDGRGTPYGVKGGRIQQIQKRYDTSSKGPDVWPTGINQVLLPFSHPRPIDRSSGLARSACLVDTRLAHPPSTAPSRAHTGHQTRLIGISTSPALPLRASLARPINRHAGSFFFPGFFGFWL